MTVMSMLIFFPDFFRSFYPFKLQFFISATSVACFSYLTSVGRFFKINSLAENPTW